MKQLITKIAFLFLLSPVCYAHTGDILPNTMWYGLLHPLTGLDHLFTLIAIGMLAARNRPAEKLILPAVFLSAMAVGFAFSITGFSLNPAENIIAISAVFLGVWLISGKQLGGASMLIVVALCAVAHGYAHGTEVTGSTIHYFSGFISTAFLLIVVTFLAFRYALPHKNKIQSFFGAGMTGLGLFYLLQI